MKHIIKEGCHGFAGILNQCFLRLVNLEAPVRAAAELVDVIGKAHNVMGHVRGHAQTPDDESHGTNNT